MKRDTAGREASLREIESAASETMRVFEDVDLARAMEAADMAASFVSARAHEAYSLNVTLEFMPTREIPTRISLACLPRQGAQRNEVEALELPEETRKWLVGINSTVMDWLAKDAGNQRAFLADPIAALAAAGVDAERSQLKELARYRESASMAEAVPAGLELSALDVKVRKTGRVKPVEAQATDWNPPPLAHEHDEDCDCKDEARD